MKATAKNSWLFITACYLSTASTIGLLPCTFNVVSPVGAAPSEQSDPNGLGPAERLEDEAKQYARQGDWANAVKSYRQYVSIREQSGFANSSSMATTYWQMSNYLEYSGKIDEAEKYAKLALAICEKNPGLPRANLMGALNGMVSFYCRRNLQTKAIPYYKQMVKTDPNWSPTDTEGALGKIYMSLGQYSEAEPLLKLCVEKLDERNGSDGKDFSNYDPIPFVLLLAVAATKQGHFNVAKPYFDRVKGYFDHQKHEYNGDKYPTDVLQAYSEYLLNSGQYVEYVVCKFRLKKQSVIENLFDRPCVSCGLG